MPGACKLQARAAHWGCSRRLGGKGRAGHWGCSRRLGGKGRRGERMPTEASNPFSRQKQVNKTAILHPLLERGRHCQRHANGAPLALSTEVELTPCSRC